MKQKTIHLDPETYSIDDNGDVVYFTILHYEYDDGTTGKESYKIYGEDSDGYPIYRDGFPVGGFVKSKNYRVGNRALLMSSEDVSPNALRSGQNTERFYLRFDRPNGAPGNMNSNIYRFHGWRGTTCDNYVYAYGEREIIKIRKLKNGTVAVTVGEDLTADIA